MAINTQKFLPGSGGTTKSVPQAKISSITLTSQDKKSVNTIRVRTIQIDKMLKGTLAADKKRLTDKKKEASQQRKEDIETGLEKKPDPKKKITMPKILPRTGILDWIKNFIGNILLGYFAVRLLKHLPALKGIFTTIVSVGEFIIDWGGKLLNAVVTFIDWGYKIYDGFKGQVGKVFGDDGLKKFDAFMSGLNNFLNAVLILGLAIARVAPKFLGKGGKGGRVGRINRGGRSNKVTTSGGRTVPRIASSYPGKLPKIPGFGGVGRIIGPVFTVLDFFNRKGAGQTNVQAGVGAGSSWAGFTAGSAVAAKVLSPLLVTPIPGARIVYGLGVFGSGILGAMGLSSVADTATGANKVTGMNKGGRVKKATRTVKTRIKRRKKIRRAPYIQQIKIDPGKDVGGEKKLEKSPWWNPFGWGRGEEKKDEVNLLDYFKKYGDKFGKLGYFGPMATLGIKALVGQKPSDEDYADAALGLSALTASSALGFAAGGKVDRASLQQDFIKEELKKSFVPIVNEVVGDIERNLNLDPGDSATGSGRVSPPGGTSGSIGSTYATASSGEYGDILDLIGSVEAKSYDTINAGHIDGLSTMTIAGARRAALNAGYGSGAMGRYQQMPQFVLDRARSIGLDPNKDLFSPENQDKLAILLINGGGYKAWKSGSMTTEKFAYNLAGTWRGLPEGPSNLTYQDQYASGNKAHTTWDNVMRVLSGSKTSGSVMSGDYNKGPAPGKEGHVEEMQSQDLAGMSPGKAKQIYLHWTAGNYNSVVGPYHSIFTGDGKMHRRVDYSTRSSHTYGRNTNSVGLSVAAMAGGSGNYQWPKNKQLDAMAAEAARLGKSWGWKASDINIKNIMTHGEAASNKDGRNMHDNYGPWVWGGTGERWDLDKLGPNDEIGDGGNEMRDRIKAKMWKGGFTKSGAHTALLGERGREFVMDADSTAAIESALPGVLSIANKKKGKDAVDALRAYASYENKFATSANQIVPIPIRMPIPVKESGGGGTVVIGGGQDPFKGLAAIG